MEVNYKLPEPRSGTVTITLTSMEAGFLRSILYKTQRAAGGSGFAANLLRELDSLSLEDYDARYPNWRRPQHD